MHRIPNIVHARLKAETLEASHPDANALSAFAEKSLTEGERSEVLDHLARCVECRDILALALPATESLQLAAKPSPTRSLTWPALRWGFVTAGVAVITTFGVMQYQHHVEPIAQFAKPSSHNGDVKLSAKALPAPLNSDVPAKQMEKSVAQAASPANLDKSTAPSPELRADQKPEHRAPAAALPYAPRPNTMVARGFLTQSAPSSVIPGPSQRNQLAPRQENSPDLNKKLPAASETVEVQAASPAPEQESQLQGQSIAAAPAADDSGARVGKAKDATPSSGAVTATNHLAVSGRNFTQLAAPVPGIAPRWNITSTGGLQRSYDQGSTWQDVDANIAFSTGATIGGPLKAPAAKADATTMSPKRQAAPPTFRAVAANGADVWAGGTSAMLYHSTDAGNHWSRVLPSGAGSVLTGDIISVEFPDAQHGKITTSTPEVWTTPDNGETWQKQ
jgi:hypothetical protein